MGNQCNCLEFKETNEIPINHQLSSESNMKLPKSASGTSTNPVIYSPSLSFRNLLILSRLQAHIRGILIRKCFKLRKTGFNCKQRLISSTFDTNYSFTDKDIIVLN